MSPTDMSKHKEAFLVEAREHVAAMNAALLKLEEYPGDSSASHDILRATHTLKSMAAAMDYTHMAELCHVMEDLLIAIRDAPVRVHACANVLFGSFDHLEAILRAISNNEPEPDGMVFIEKLRVLVDKDLKHAVLENPNIDLKDRPTASILEPIHTVSVSVDKLDVLLNLAEEMLVSRMRLVRIKDKLANPELSASVESIGRLITDLQYNVMQARTVPIGFVFGRFRRMVRDLAQLQGKEVELVLEGNDIELDRGMIDEVSECLVHLLRNAVDHGIEAPEERLQKNKPRGGKIKLTVNRTKESALIFIEDDGVGLDLEAIKRAGVQRGTLGLDASTEEIIQAIFLGVSTTEQVTAVSGRGMGLNIAKKKIETIGGAVRVESEPSRGTRFTIEIPLTLAVIKTLFVMVSGKTYAIPVGNIERLVTINHTDLKSALGHEMVVIERQEIPIARLDALFGCNPTRRERQALVIVRKGDARVGVAVDALMATEEVVIKPLSRLFRQNRFFAGSALIGSGEVALVLDVGHLALSSKNAVFEDTASEGSFKEYAMA